MIWSNRFENLWNAKYAEAKAYFLREGHLDVPFFHVTEKGTLLGRWIYNQRRARLNPKEEKRLSSEQIAKLDEIGMLWGEERYADPWERRYQLACAYYEVNNDLRISAQHVTEDGIWLGKWVYEQRNIRNGKVEGKTLSGEQVAKLDAIGMSWLSPDEKAWEENYAHARAYFLAHGNLDCLTPYYAPNGKRLDCWIRVQRRHAFNQTLAPQQLERLRAIGIATTRKAQIAWETSYTAAKDFYRTHGHLNVPARYVTQDGINLGIWISNVRQKARNSKLDAEQVKQLDAIGMLWENKYEENWNANYEEARAYFEMNGHLNVPSQHITPTGFRLGYWIYAHRKTRAHPEKSKITLNDERIAKLDEIGMVWGGKCQKPQRRPRSYEVASMRKRVPVPQEPSTLQAAQM